MPDSSVALDATDAAILEVLQRDGRAPFAAIAREVGLSETAVRQRCQRVFDAGLVSIVATGDPLRLGVAVDAIHLVQVDALEHESVADVVAAMPEVRYVGVTLGGSVLIVESLHRSPDHLHAFIVDRLSSLSGVKEVNSHQVVDIRKSTWDWQSWLASPDADEAPSRPRQEALPPAPDKEPA